MKRCKYVLETTAQKPKKENMSAAVVPKVARVAPRRRRIEGSSLSPSIYSTSTHVQADRLMLLHIL